MSFGFSCLNYNHRDENDLCMKNNTIPNEHSYLAPIKYGENEFVVEITTKTIDSSSQFISYSLDGDHEQISMQMVSRYLLKCSDCLVYPSSLTPHIKVCTENISMFRVLKSRIGISLSTTENEINRDIPEGTSYEADLQHSVSFHMFHILLENGYQAFATDDQLRGVVSMRIDDNYMNVCAIKTISPGKQAENYTITFEMLRYKATVLTIDTVRSYDEEVKSQQKNPSETHTAWRILARPMSCVFLPSNETIQLLAVIPYIPQKITSNTTSNTTGTGTKRNLDLSQSHRAYEQEVFLTHLDRTNRTHGYSTFLPDTYARVRLYWELAYGIHLPKCPGDSEKDYVYFARVSLPLDEQIVPLCTLARGTAEIPWKNETECKTAASNVHRCFQSCSLIENVSLPQRPSELSQQLRNRMHDHPDHKVHPLSGVFASALRYKQQCSAGSQNKTNPQQTVVPRPFIKPIGSVLQQPVPSFKKEVVVEKTSATVPRADESITLLPCSSQESTSSVSLSLSNSSNSQASISPVLPLPVQQKQQNQHRDNKTIKNPPIHSFKNKHNNPTIHMNNHGSNSKVVNHGVVNKKSNLVSTNTSKQLQKGRFKSPVQKCARLVEK